MWEVEQNSYSTKEQLSDSKKLIFDDVRAMRNFRNLFCFPTKRWRGPQIWPDLKIDKN
jgi:hypothetical protein